MPYTKPERRSPLDPAIYLLAKSLKSIDYQKGDLNYAVSRLLWLLVRDNIGYSKCSEAKGALEDAAQEFYRRVLAPYEDKKSKENGDVYYVEEE